MDTRPNIDERTFRSTPCRFASRNQRWWRQSIHRIAEVIAIFALWATGFASAAQQPQEVSSSFQVPRNDLANAQALANQLAALSPRVDRNEAKLLADCAYATVSQLRRQYRMFGTPIFNNFLIYHGLKKRGYCYQWSEDLLIALDVLRLGSLELRWGEANPDNWRENNCLVVTAKGRPFRSGIMLDCWRHLGQLYFGPVASSWEPYVENSAFARDVRHIAAARNVSEHNHHVAFHSRTDASGKTRD